MTIFVFLFSVLFFFNCNYLKDILPVFSNKTLVAILHYVSMHLMCLLSWLLSKFSVYIWYSVV